MAEVESSSVMLRRLWANTWDAARFAAERPLHKPAFELSACGVQLELAAQAVARIREATGKDFEVTEFVPLEGRSCSLLELAVSEGRGLPHPAEDPVGFVEAMIHAALQTGDGSYGFGLQGKPEVDALIAKHCEDLLNSARGLQDPAVATRDVESAAAELSGAVQALLARDVGASSKAEAVAFSSRVLQLSREMRSLAGRMQEVATQKAGEVEPPADVETAGPEPSTDMSDSTDPVGVPAFQEDDIAMETDGGGAADDAGEMLQRTKSQVVKRIKVDEVAQALEARREPIQQLRRVLSQLDSKGRTTAGGDSTESRFDWKTGELKQVQKLQQSFRNFGEDLMEGILTLDQLSGLAEQDRQVRKETLKGLQGLLDEIDAAKPRVAKMQKKLATELDELKPALQAEQQQQQPGGGADYSGMAVEEQHQEKQQPRQAHQQHQEQQPQQQVPRSAAAPLAAPRVDWTRLKLPLQFSSLERPRAYLLSASAAGLDPDSIRLSRRDGGVLRVQGARLPSASEQKALTRLLAEHIERMPWKQRQHLTQEEADEMLLQLGHGRFGLFQQEFELPHDVDWATIEPSYEDGVLRIVLPRHVLTQRARPGGWMQGMPDSYHRRPNDFLW